MTSMSTFPDQGITQESTKPSTHPSTPLDQLERQPQWIDCPSCKQRAQTMVRGRSEGMKRFMDFWFWPIPGRRHWFETTRWTCRNCGKEIASQRNGKDVKVLVETL